MTIQDAIKSGKRFKKTGSSYWQGPILGNLETYSFGSEKWVSDLFADYEIEEETIQITKSQFIKAVSEIAKERASNIGYQLLFYGPNGPESLDSQLGIDLIKEQLNSLINKLGFKS